jgi:hypothetical protein
VFRIIDKKGKYIPNYVESIDFENIQILDTEGCQKLTKVEYCTQYNNGDQNIILRKGSQCPIYLVD